MADTPQLDTVTPASARAGAQLTLAGAGFGDQTPGSAVRFRLPEPGAAAVDGPIVDWADATIHVQVPPLASFGSGGPLELVVHSDAGDSGAVAFLLEEDAPPAITAVTPARGLEGEPIAITGDRFGRQTADSAVVFQAPGPVDVPAEVVSWIPGSITVRVPSLASLGGAGPRSLAVRTAWGRSASAAFLLGQLPVVASVDPPSPSPGATITVRGSAFGPRPPGRLDLVAVSDIQDPPPNTTAPPILSWTDTEIQARLPELQELRTTGLRDAIVTSEWGASIPDPHSRFLIESRASITCWTRVEPHARTADLQQGLELGLQAQVYDALWLLGRQWQLLELKGQDAGSPVTVQVNGTCTPLARWQPHGGQPEDVLAGVPLEAVVERERVIPPLGTAGGPFGDLRLAAEAGLQLLRMIDAQLRDPRKSDDYRKRFLRDYPLDVPGDAASLDARSRRFLSVAAQRVPDGSRIYADFQVALGPNPKLPKKPPIDGNDRSGVLAAIGAWYTWCDGLFSESTPGQRAWDPGRMEYSFAAGSGSVVLDASEHDGGHLDWYSFVRRAPGSTLGAPAAGRGPIAFTRSAIPNPVSYPGMPVPRWWELEDRRVDFGSVAAGPSELLKLVLIEFATVYGNDWFTLPLDALPVGSLCEIGAVTVTDAFGVSINLAPFGDGAGTDWRMFELSRDDGAANAGNALLLLDSLPTTLESGPIEDVVMLRDELANMAWAVEKVIESRTGRPLDRHEDEV
ncbi:MAG TPA: IPT/TIG domain-containing protein, partial [Kofleriaceae bacterium]